MGRKKRGKFMTKHHVPPRSRGKLKFTMKVPWYLHRAYHTVFGNAESYEQCCEILKKWWFQ